MITSGDAPAVGQPGRHGTGARATASALGRNRRLEVGHVSVGIDVAARDHGDEGPVEPHEAGLARAEPGAPRPTAPPDGSTTSRASSAASRTAAAISPSDTVTTASRWRARCAKLRAPIDWGARPVGDRAAH